MKTNNNIPAYRFQGYTDAWELRKLGKVADVFDGTHQTPRYTNQGVMFLSVEDINTLESEKYISSEDFEKEFKIFPEFNDVLMTRIGDIGTSNIVKTNDKIAYYVSLALIKPKKLESHFLNSIIQSKDFQNELWKRTLHIAFPKKINKGEISEINLMFPTLSEQTAIGTFFSTLDQHITLHQRKLDTLKEQKKTYLKLLFPAKGQTKPALRFQGFEDDWEVKRISDIGDIVTGNTPSTSNEDYYSNEGMMWVTPTDIDGLIITDTNKKLSPEGEKVSRIVPANSILVTCIASIGKNTLLLEAGSFNQQINAVVPNQSLYHSYFLLTQSYFWSESMKRIAPAATMQIINKNEFSNITVTLPTLPEQEAIGTFFQNLDQEMAQVEDKLASLKEMKKTLLRKLFVSWGMRSYHALPMSRSPSGAFLDCQSSQAVRREFF